MTIKVLSPQVAAKIAAGEVVERPASVVKELVENALDAGAGQIAVETKGGGLESIRITDDGSGIAADEVETAFGRYATSKITRVEDLDNIATLGFRGEALASIAAVAQIDLTTGTKESTAGDALTLKDGIVIRHVQQARPHGTTITVRDLFRNVPARLKFLKSAATENSHIAGVVSQYALAYPEIRFFLNIDGRTALQTSGSGKLADAVIEVYGIETAQRMLEISGGEVGWQDGRVVPITVTGMVGAPAVNKAGRDALSFFVNRRVIGSRLLTRAVEEAYQGMLMQGRHPIAIVNIVLPPSEVDVNIHPTKAEVKFQNERAVFTAVQRAVRSALVAGAPVTKIEEAQKSYTGQSSGMAQSLWSVPAGKNDSTSVPPSGTQSPRQTLPLLRVLGQAAGNYIVAEGPDGLYVIDQHAAHERIMYEQLLAQKAGRGIQLQGMLEPYSFEVTPPQDEMLKSGAAALQDFGFTIEPFGERTYLVRAVPAVLKDGSWLEALKEILGSPCDKTTNVEDDIIKSLACHSAVRAGKTLTDDEMRELIRLLEQTNLPNTCPHGRPTILHLSTGQLEKEFGRT
ncbi:MAG: DNA mismatch repair endonuclease MutL [Dehalococcoidales bacterium]